MMMQQEYLIQDLADLAEVSPRTIRYYTQEGILPEPINRGKFAYYTEEHLDRLALIRHLKDTYLPLKEIRQMMASLSWAEVRDLLSPQAKEAEKPDSSSPPQVGSRVVREGDSALEYIQRLLGTQTDLSQPDAHRLHKFSPPAKKEALYSQTKTPPESWRRITLAPGVELNIREPYTAIDPKRIDDLIQFAQKLFSQK